MTQQEIKDKLNEVYALIESESYRAAIARTSEYVKLAGDYMLQGEIDDVAESYRHLLGYVADGVIDPERHNVLRRLVKRVYSIADRAAIRLGEATGSREVFFVRRADLRNTTLADIAAGLKRDASRIAMINELPEAERDGQALITAHASLEQQETNLFNKIWSTVPMSDDDTQLIASIISDNNLPLHSRCLVVAACLLGLLKFYDEAKLALLAQTYISVADDELAMRALLYLVLAMSLHRRRVALGGTALEQRVSAMTEVASLTDDIAIVQQRLAKARNTANISRHVRDDLMNDIAKVSPDVQDRLRGMAPGEDGDVNPEWEQVMRDSGIADKIQEINELQMEGNDVYAGSFAHLKSFPFFKTLANWFRPFHLDHSLLMGDGDKVIAELMQHARLGGGLCNSDLFSFAMSLRGMMAASRDQLATTLATQAEAMEQARADRVAEDRHHRRDRIVVACVQDLYRFFNVFSRRREFAPAFDTALDLRDLPLLERYTRRPEMLNVLAEFYLANGFYDDAISHFRDLLACDGDTSPVVYQKIGYAHQRMGHYHEAIDNYKLYDLADDSNVWTLRNMASCYRMLGEYDRALELYDRILAFKPGHLATMLSVGHTLLEAERYDKAMNQYLHVDLTEGAGHRAWRAIAWCALMMGDTERSVAYYDRIVAQDAPDTADHLNHGHALLVAGRVTEAIDCYRLSLRATKGGPDEFRRQFEADRHHLVRLGVEPTDVSLVIDAANIS